MITFTVPSPWQERPWAGPDRMFAFGGVDHTTYKLFINKDTGRGSLVRSPMGIRLARFSTPEEAFEQSIHIIEGEIYEILERSAKHLLEAERVLQLLGWDPSDWMRGRVEVGA